MDAVSGGAGDDTITGLLGVSGTYTLGDNIIGGAGTDTLNLIVASGASAGVGAEPGKRYASGARDFDLHVGELLQLAIRDGGFGS